ncbi:MAG: RNA polymerase sigma factor [Gammaproteobacteria bacterium]|nr:MAG: RNA polymerase sigma factor [Gammaproteobacteria bacterium]
MKRLTDEALVLRCQATKSPDAFSELVKRHQSNLRHFVRRLSGGDHALADDVVQEAFWAAYRNIHQFRAESTFSTWLHKIAYHHFLTMKKRWQPVPLPMPPARSPMQDPDKDIVVEQLMRHLSVKERLVMTLAYGAGFSHAEIAQVAEMPVGTVKSIQRRATQKLQRWLDDASCAPGLEEKNRCQRS